MNETLAADLSSIALRLLVAVWMAGGTGVVLSRRELEVRAGLSHNSLDLARSQLVARNLLAVESLGDGKSNRYTLRITAPAPAEGATVEQPNNVKVLQDAFRTAFPREAKTYPLTQANARRLLGLADVNRVVEVFEHVARNPNVKAPKAYIEKILKEEPKEEEEAPEEVIALIRKGQQRENLFS